MQRAFLLSCLFAVVVTAKAAAHDPHQAASYLATTPNPGRLADDIALRTLRDLDPDIVQAVQSIILRDRIWNNPHVTICFGPAQVVSDRIELVQQIISIASEWQEETKLSLDFGENVPRACSDSASANIRVNIDYPSNGFGLFQSLVGNQAAQWSIEGFEPYSMTIQFPKNHSYFSNMDVVRFYVLHEFGHALGAEHEHQRIDCKYNYTYIAENFGFQSTSVARANMEQIFKTKVNAYPNGKALLSDTTVETEYDNYSVLKYNLATKMIPSGDDPKVYKEKERSSCYRPGWVSEISAYDHAGMRLAYSAPNVAIAALIASLSKPSGFDAIPSSVRSRLTDPALGRIALKELVESKSLAAPINQTAATRSIFREIELLQNSPQATGVLMGILANRASNDQ